MGEDWEPSEKAVLLGNRGPLDRKVHSLSLKQTVVNWKYIYTFSPYRAVNTLRLGEELVNAVEGIRRSSEMLRSEYW